MNGKRLLARTGLVAALGVLIFLVLGSAMSHATPIRPDLQKMLKQSQQTKNPFIPARAGWSDASGTPQLHDPALETLREEKVRQGFRDTLMALATPDPVVVFSLGLVILLMRKLRSLENQRQRLAEVRVISEVPAPRRLAA